MKYFGDGNQWRKILEDNKATITNPDRIYVGQVIIINITGNGTQTAGTTSTTNAAGTTTDAEIVDGKLKSEIPHYIFLVQLLLC